MAGTFLKIILISIVTQIITASAQEVQDRYYPRYHLAPPYGWMNDPNGFCVFNNEYHLFYQHNPNSSLTSTLVHWGHAKSPDLVTWEHLPIAMYPDQWYDAGGVFSGSALVENDTMYLFYTGNVISPAANRQALATSTDGVTVTNVVPTQTCLRVKYVKVESRGDDCYNIVFELYLGQVGVGTTTREARRSGSVELQP